MIDFSTTQTVKVSLSFLLTVGQCLGYFPTFPTHFKWKSWKVYHVIFITTSVALCNVITFIWALKQLEKELSFAKFETIFMCVAITTNSLLLLRLATKWPDLMKEWNRNDKIMNKIYGHPKYLKLLITLVTIFFLLLSTVVYFLQQLLCLCGEDQDQDPLSVKLYYDNCFCTISSMVPYHPLIAIFVTILQFEAYLLLSFTDVFLIALSAILAFRFHQIAARLKQNQRQQSGMEAEDASFWKNIRKDYCRLSSLLFVLDDHISFLIIYSYGLNFLSLLHFLTQFLRGMETTTLATIHSYFNAFSFISRLTCLTLFSSWINEESQEPIRILNSVPPNEYSAEVGRLLLQLSFDEVALTGCKMFKLNKKLLLSIVSAIVTYELMIIQYNNSYI